MPPFSLVVPFVQLLNGMQLGVLLFLSAAGLTLIFGIMNFINLAHGVLFTLGAYAGSLLLAHTGSFWVALVGAPLLVGAAGMLLERLLLRDFLGRSHLDQVLLTFGLVLVIEEGLRALFGSDVQPMALPAMLRGSIRLSGFIYYPVYRLVIIGVGIASALGLGWLVTRTRLGIFIRASASNRPMAVAMGVDVDRLSMIVFGLGGALASLAGVIAAPIVAVEPNMGGRILILSLVVVVVGGLGSVSGAFVAAMLIGLVDAFGRSYLTDLLRLLMPPSAATQIGPALASMMIYLFMAVMLCVAPRGLAGLVGRAK